MASDTEMQKVFKARLVDDTGHGTLTDGSVLYEVVTNEGVRIASCVSDIGAQRLEYALNLACTEWVERNPSDRVIA